MAMPKSITLSSPSYPADEVTVRTVAGGANGASVHLTTREVAHMSDPQRTKITVNTAELRAAIDEVAGKAEAPDLEKLEGEIADLLRSTRDIPQSERAKRITSLVRDAFGVKTDPEWYNAKVIKVHWYGRDRFLTRRAGDYHDEPWIWDTGVFYGNKFIEKTLGEVQIVVA